jgi:hypothetical protein
MWREDSCLSAKNLPILSMHSTKKYDFCQELRVGFAVKRCVSSRVVRDYQNLQFLEKKFEFTVRANDVE